MQSGTAPGIRWHLAQNGEEELHRPLGPRLQPADQPYFFTPLTIVAEMPPNYPKLKF